MFLTLFITVIIIFLTFLYGVHRKSLKTLEKYKDIPGPKGVAIIGNVFHFIQEDVEGVQNKILQFFEEYGDTYMIWSAKRYTIITSNPKAIEDILSSTNKHMSKNFIYDLLRPWLNEGLLLSVDHKWHSRRKILTPAFHFKILESFVPIFGHHSNKLVENIRKLNATEHEAYEIHELIANVTLNSIAETSMGIRTDDDTTYVEAVKEMTHTISNRFIKFYYRNDFLCFFTKNYLWRKYRKLLKVLHRYTEKTILERRDYLLDLNLKELKGNIEDMDDFGQKRKQVFLDILLQSVIDYKPLSDLDIREEVDTFMFEGHDTTTAGLCFTLSMISRHSNVQEKIFNEIVEVIGKDKNKPVSYRELQELKYLDMVIKETLRLHPPVSLIGRIISEDSMIGGKFYPKGSEVILHLRQMMRNPELFPNPNEFIPERHSTSDFNVKYPYAFVPFSAGPRNCIGQKYAMLEMKSVITKVLRNFELLPNGPDFKPFINIILKSMTGFKMGFKERKYE